MVTLLLSNFATGMSGQISTTLDYKNLMKIHSPAHKPSQGQQWTDAHVAKSTGSFNKLFVVSVQSRSSTVYSHYFE